MSDEVKYNQFQRGSIWRKWDLQVHTPFSHLSNGFGDDFDEYVKKLFKAAIEKQIAVIGITDYFCIEGYKKIKQEYLNNDTKLAELFTDKEIKQIKKIKLFPNVEFRLDTLVDGNRVNFHVIFSDEVLITDIEENFLHELDFIYEGNPQGTDEKWKLKIPNLETLGQSLKKEHAEFNSDTDLFVGMKCAVVNHTQIAEILTNKKSKFAGMYMMCVPSDEDLSKISWDGQDHNVRKIYIQKSDVLISSNQATINWGLGRKHENPQEYINEFKSLKPCIWGSDSHTYEKLFEPDNKRYTWIKSNPTFDGLKQLLFEPSERVKIQEQNPYEEKKKIYFDSIKLTGSKNFVLPDLEILLNRELIALIGGRGSGKSALLDTFAFLNEEHLKLDQNNKKKIIEYYRDNEARTEPRPSYTFKTSLIDKDGDMSEFEKELSDKTNLELPFLYLGQERLSGIATNDFELTRTVCDLIGIDVNEIGQEVLTSKARDVLGDIDNTQQRTRDIIERYKELGYTEGEDLEKWIASYLAKLTDQQKRLSSKETKETLDEINKKTEKGLKLKELKEKANTLLLGLRELPITQEIANFNIILKNHYPDNEEIEGLNISKQTKVLSELQTKIEADMTKLREEIIALKKKLIEQGIKEDVNTLLQASENLQRQISNIGKDLENYNRSITQLVDLHEEKRKILEQISNSLLALRNAITQAFKDFQNSRDDSTAEEKELFEKIINGIEVEGKIEFNFKKFAKRVLDDFLDNRKVANETDLKKMIAGTNEDGTPREITFENLSVWIQKTDLGEQKCFSRDGISGITYYIFTEWADFLGVKAIAKLNGKATEILSIGQRGTLLLKVYLATATAKQVFIIDQPEDNLDNNFIMNELVPLIRKAKQSRQIIMSTHNANLVVNADAEQIIVARLDQELGYLSGSIENPEINKNIRDILEGGEEAFRQRERKYLLNK